MKDLINVFNDTMQYSNELTNSITKKYTFDNILRQLYRKNEPPAIPSNFYNVKVENSDTVSSLVNLSKVGKTAVLNMASYKRPGGGVARGARAQEESLFRCSNLGKVISKEDFYPLKENEALYTKDAIFFKDKDYEYMDEVKCDVITIAALRLHANIKEDGEIYYEFDSKDEDYKDLTKDKIRLMLSMAALNGVKNLVLGAWGCGVFKNDPATIANYFKEILIYERYANLFDNIVFAIINDHNSNGNNFDIFNKILK